MSGLSLNRPSFELQKTLVVTNSLSVVAAQEMLARFMYQDHKLLRKDG